MNKSRRNAASAIEAAISDLIEQAQALIDAEQEAFDNMPESLQSGEKGERAQAAIDHLEAARDLLEQSQSDFESAREV